MNAAHIADNATAETHEIGSVRLTTEGRECLLLSLGYVCIAMGVGVMAFGGWIMFSARAAQVV